jgi:hypothetical protein
MALYEILLRNDGYRELRLTDRPYELGQTVEIMGVDWKVERIDRPRSSSAESRFVLGRRVVKGDAKTSG